MYPYNTNPFDSQEYETQALPYVPYATSGETVAHSYNASGDALSNEVYPPAPSVYENTSAYAQYEQTTTTTPPAQLNEPLVANPFIATTSAKKKRRWLPITIVILTILIVGASAFALVLYLNRSTPTKTLDTFCTALQDGKYQTAYDQLTPAMQTNFTESQFATILSSDSVQRCSHGTVNENGTSTTTDLHLFHKTSGGTNNDKVIVTKDSHNQWKISNILKVS